MVLYIILDIVIFKLVPVLIYLYSTGKSLWQLFIEQFDDLLVKILLAAATISFVSVHCDSYHTISHICLAWSYIKIKLFHLYMY